MANKPLDDGKTGEGVSRREMFKKAGVGVAGVVVGGAVVGVMPRRAAPSAAGAGRVDWAEHRELHGLPAVPGGVLAHQGAEDPAGDCADQRAPVLPGVEFPVACYQCGEDAKCVEACPMTALSVDTSKKLNTIVRRHDAVPADGEEQRLHAVPGQVSGAGGDVPSEDAGAADLRPVRGRSGVREGVPVEHADAQGREDGGGPAGADCGGVGGGVQGAGSGNDGGARRPPRGRRRPGGAGRRAGQGRRADAGGAGRARRGAGWTGAPGGPGRRADPAASAGAVRRRGAVAEPAWLIDDSV